MGCPLFAVAPPKGCVSTTLTCVNGPKSGTNYGIFRNLSPLLCHKAAALQAGLAISLSILLRRSNNISQAIPTPWQPRAKYLQPGGENGLAKG